MEPMPGASGQNGSEYMNKYREARKAARLTQKEMADLLGIPKRTIGNWETEVNTPAEWVWRLVEEKLESMKKDPS